MISPVLEVLGGACRSLPPVWLMRQAGRYLPEYRALRARAGSFWNLCFTPELASEATLQPIRRFGFDAAIMFSDILVIPYAFGVNVWFAEGEGPRLDPVIDEETLGRLPRDPEIGRLAPLYEAIERTRAILPREVALLGFCGAPFTVATYMIAGRATSDQGPARGFAYRQPAAFGALIERLSAASVTHLLRQFSAGVDAVQIFDTWAGVLPPREFGRWVIEPTRRIIDGVRQVFPRAPIIGFPRGAGTLLSPYAAQLPLNGLGLDWTMDPSFARACVAPGVALQGNLDPLALLAGGAALDRGVEDVLAAFAGRPSFSISATASCPRRRLPMSSRCWRGLRS